MRSRGTWERENFKKVGEMKSPRKKVSRMKNAIRDEKKGYKIKKIK